ncbi:alpha/beta fold hydrolase [Duganella sp. BJB488]|uniref:alpha/beta fold hydrolase n=1 Tax=unclassified Duganella TaxID=2636909 RepID=UPI000E34F00E|nr:MULTISPECIES: alpha/beta fold hydrolase [unclassified Duganella]RFP20412.1 alpha/beta fold hydrolase [Duganella sp. BJB489]RFP21148.1 alpha/beta fold hydrolase [Duganella sp. BJB488]RFP33286.1 alpha/beta fold hydrolase [Duganella sp. BJB480]
MIVDFDVAYEGHVLKGDQYVGADSNRVLYLHGAGASTRRGHHLLRGALRQRGVGSTCFDCVGHGDTGGALAQSSVASRTRQAQTVVAARGVPEPLAIIGASMGAYNAIRMTQSHRVDALVLIVPGVYTPSAYEVPFGPEFSAVIRRERSWADSDAWEILSRFEGRLLVIAAEHDATIPLEIPERLVAAAANAQSSRLHIVQGAEHNRLWSLLEEDPASFAAAVDMVADVVNGGRQ